MAKSPWKVLPKSSPIKVTNKNAKATKTEMKWATSIAKGSKRLVGGFK